jgi:L-iditol 2-dehydrogenase
LSRSNADVIPLSVPEVAMREVMVTDIFRYTNTWPIAISLVQGVLVELDSLSTDTFVLDQVPEALAAGPSPTSLKRIVRPSVARID